ncbi:MAG: hypothetical protein CMJ18_19160 [Phycisphaeraceae bacterium]|nr:hypothetical protein [Phycisphaeraceae bacterium]
MNEVTQELHFGSVRMGAASIGAMLVTCADESELECEEAFQRGFVQYVLPPLKFAHRAPFRIANLGGRYEWGAVRIAEDHYTKPRREGEFEILVVKVNSHVAIDESDRAQARFGTWARYGEMSTSCGALTAMLDDASNPFIHDLREAFVSEGVDRTAPLRDANQVDPAYRMLFAAMVSARLQARKAVLDIQDHHSGTPTLYVVLPCVTINRVERDTEILCGIYTIDGRQGGREAVYFGLGDDPAKYEVRYANRRMTVSDDQVGAERKGRDHRSLVLSTWREAGRARVTKIDDERLERVRRDVTHGKHRDHQHARTLLRAALPIFAEVAPVPAAILLFAQGAVGIHHVFRVHRLAREMTESGEAREVLDEFHQKVDALEPERAEALLELLMKEYAH